MTFTVAAMKIFGRKEGQGIHEFGAEVKALTPEDRADMAPLMTEALRANGTLTENESVEV